MTRYDDSARRRGRRSEPTQSAPTPPVASFAPAAPASVDASLDPASAARNHALAARSRAAASEPRRRRITAVLGAVGGVGASALSAAISIRGAAAGLTTCAVDLDPLGGGLDVVFGAEQSPGLRWFDLHALEGEADGAALLAVLPEEQGVRVLAHGRDDVALTDGVVLQVVDALADVADLVVLDLGLRTPLGATLAAAADLVVLVVSTRLSGFAALTAHAQWLERSGAVPVVVLRAARHDDLVPLVESQVGLEVVGVMRDERSVRADLVHGIPPGKRRGQLTRVADSVLALAVTERDRGVA